MDNEIIFRLAILTLFVGFVAHRGYYTRKQAQLEQPAAASQASSFEKWVNLLALPGLLAVALYIVNPAWMSWAAFPLTLWIRLAGIGIALLGFGLLQWSQKSLGVNWSDDPRIRQEHQLVMNGSYQWVRHPIYTAFLLIMTSTFLITSNWFIGLMWFGMTAVDVAFRVRLEEHMLETEFGDQYLEYETRTGSLVPRIARRPEGKSSSKEPKQKPRW